MPLQLPCVQSTRRAAPRVPRVGGPSAGVGIPYVPALHLGPAGREIPTYSKSLESMVVRKP